MTPAWGLAERSHMDIPFLKKRRATGRPYCTAPFTSLVVDPNKSVRPCCTFAGSLGTLTETPLTDILSGAPWNEVKRQITHGETPQGCVNCYEREQATGWSVRLAQFDVLKAVTDRWSRGLTQLEINSSNICNLACTHCSSTFSGRWVQLGSRFRHADGYHHYYHEASGQQIHGSDPEHIVEQIAALDLTCLETVRFKGGEPMLNHDVPAVLRYLHDRDILPHVSVDFVSNGSVQNAEVLDLLRRAGRVTMCVSVDGMGRLQEYIRRGPSEIARIERFLETMSSLENIRFTLNVSVMAYNVFSLDHITAWWNGFCHKYPDKFHSTCYGLHVVDPAYLSVNVLQDSTRQGLIRKYRDLAGADYSSVIHALRQPFAGEALHNTFVSYTRDMDRLFQSDVLQVVPELEPEMAILD